MENKQLPAEVQERIIQSAVEYTNLLVFYSPDIQAAWEAGATEYAPWKVKHDELNTKAKIQEAAIELLAEKYQALKERCEKMEKVLKELVRLKDKKDKEGSFIGYPTLKLAAWDDARKALKEGESNTLAPSVEEKPSPEWVTWLTDNSPNIPNLSKIGKEEQQAIVQTLFQSCGHQFMKLFYALDLKTHMECGFVNEPTNELFRLRFELMQNGNTPAPVQGEKEVDE